MTSERARMALALQSSGHSYKEIAKKLGYKSEASARVMVYHARNAIRGRRKYIHVNVKASIYRDLQEIAKEWECTLSEVVRTFIVCGLEDLKNEGED